MISLSSDEAQKQTKSVFVINNYYELLDNLALVTDHAEFTNSLCSLLREGNKPIIRAIVDELGTERVLLFLKETCQIQENGKQTLFKFRWNEERRQDKIQNRRRCVHLSRQTFKGDQVKLEEANVQGGEQLLEG
jgi:hypothetical protein